VASWVRGARELWGATRTSFGNARTNSNAAAAARARQAALYRQRQQQQRAQQIRNQQQNRNRASTYRAPAYNGSYQRPPANGAGRFSCKMCVGRTIKQYQQFVMRDPSAGKVHNVRCCTYSIIVICYRAARSPRYLVSYCYVRPSHIAFFSHVHSNCRCQLCCWQVQQQHVQHWKDCCGAHVLPCGIPSEQQQLAKFVGSPRRLVSPFAVATNRALLLVADGSLIIQCANPCCCMHINILSMTVGREVFAVRTITTLWYCNN